VQVLTPGGASPDLTGEVLTGWRVGRLRLCGLAFAWL
jgi:hypothetical protein